MLVWGFVYSGRHPISRRDQMRLASHRTSWKFPQGRRGDCRINWAA